MWVHSFICTWPRWATKIYKTGSIKKLQTFKTFLGNPCLTCVQGSFRSHMIWWFCKKKKILPKKCFDVLMMQVVFCKNLIKISMYFSATVPLFTLRILRIRQAQFINMSGFAILRRNEKPYSTCWTDIIRQIKLDCVSNQMSWRCHYNTYIITRIKVFGLPLEYCTDLTLGEHADGYDMSGL